MLKQQLVLQEHKSKSWAPSFISTFGLSSDVICFFPRGANGVTTILAMQVVAPVKMTFQM
jgi:hypothetical protein